jgi:hypothetical protein
MHQEAFPGEDISDRPLPEESVPGFVILLNGSYPSGRYQARALIEASHETSDETSDDGSDPGAITVHQSDRAEV